MDKKTRVLNAFNQKEVDRVPVGFWFHFTGEETKGQACIDAHLKFYDEINPDMVKIMSDSYFPYPFEVDIKESSDWRKIKPLGANHPFIREQVERVKGITDKIGKECCTFYNVFAPFSSIRFGTSDDLVMKHLKEDPEAILHALDVIAQDNATIAELVITEGGCDGIYYCLQGGEEYRFSSEDYAKYIAPTDLFVLEHANKFSENNILHCCGWAGDKNRMENWKNYPAKVINWAVYVEDLSVVKGKEFFGGKTILGGFDNRVNALLFNGSKEEVQAETVKIINNFGKTGLIIGADCTLSAAIDKKRINWVIEASSSLA